MRPASSISRSSHLRWVLLASFVSSAPDLACSLDSRQLELASDEGGGSGSPSGLAGSLGVASAGHGSAGRAGATAAAGRGGADDNGGSAGGVDESPPIVDGCVDLDQNGVGDCEETLVKNADFEADVSDWTAEQDTLIELDTHDAWGVGGTPGSALVSSIGVLDPNSENAVLRAASQCVAVGGMQLVTVYANAFVESGQSDPTGRAQVVVFFFDGDNCTGAFTNSFTTPQPLNTDGIDTWLTLKAGSVTGLSTQSILVKLGLSRAYSAESFRARFDNVLVRAQTP